LSYEDDSTKIKTNGDNSPMSKLKSLMEAEQELNEIFSENKSRTNNAAADGTYCNSFRLFPPQWSPEKSCNSLSKNNLNESTS
jgi:hypothetical protein